MSTIQSIAIRRNRRAAYLFLLPNIAGFLVFILLPVVASLTISVTDWNGFTRANFVGVGNFVSMFSSTAFRISLVNTLTYSLFVVPFTVMLSLLVAIMLNSDLAGLSYFRTAFYLPHISASVAVAVIWQLIFHPNLGPINSFLMRLGVQNPPRWFGSSDWAMTGVIVVSIWKRVGYFMVLFLAGLQTIPRQLYESADIDGASTIRKLWHITIPMISPTTFLVTIMATIASFKAFDLIYNLTLGGPGRATNVLVYTIYQESFQRFRFGYASAIAYFLFAIVLLVTLIQFRIQKKSVHYY